jgi:hypothetical protein
VLLFVRTPLQPPVAEAVESQALKAVLTAVWVWQETTVVLTGQFNITVGCAGTVKVA